jgi:hypothetical protein
MFLVRAAFRHSVVVLLLPGDPQTGADAPRVSAFQALLAARSAVADVSSFCDRNPDVCATGSTALQVFAAKVRYGTELISGYFNGKDGKAESKTVDRGTLKGEDLQPAWRGHAPKDKAA